VLTTEPVVVIDNHFRIPIGKTDMLKAPDHFPCPVYRYTLSEISILWSMYGGQDFESSGIQQSVFFLYSSECAIR